jgi:hypothetical protein
VVVTSSQVKRKGDTEQHDQENNEEAEDRHDTFPFPPAFAG